jgi:PadR family transcriptional regulator AphA
MPEPGEQQLRLSAWLVLCVVCEQPTHGFAVPGLFSRKGSLGRVWQVSKPALYAAMGRLERLSLVQLAGAQHTSQGPARSLVKATPAGQTAARKWLRTPVMHGREVRSELMIKLALLDRAGDDPMQLLREQRAKFASLAAALANRVHDHRDRAHAGAVAHQALSATMQFVDDVTRRAELASAADQAATSSHAAFPATGPA